MLSTLDEERIRDSQDLAPQEAAVLVEARGHGNAQRAETWKSLKRVVLLSLLTNVAEHVDKEEETELFCVQGLKEDGVRPIYTDRELIQSERNNAKQLHRDTLETKKEIESAKEEAEQADEEYFYQQLILKRDEVSVKALPLGIVVSVFVVFAVDVRSPQMTMYFFFVACEQEAARRRKAMLGTSLMLREKSSSSSRPRSRTSNKELLQTLAAKHQERQRSLDPTRPYAPTPEEYLESLLNST